jgi:hypothetical protein
MISSEIAKASGRKPLRWSRDPGKVTGPRTNPRLLAPQDGVSLTSESDVQKNGAIGGRITTGKASVTTMLPPGAERKQVVSNGNTGASFTSRGAAKYANPRPIVEVNGQMWNLA